MKIFVGYGYDGRDKWIEDHVFDLIRAFGGEPVTGKEIPGQPLEEGVRQQIRDCDAMLAFTTRRKRIREGRYTTHRWVTDEIITAIDAGLSFVEVREVGVDNQAGMPGGRQYITYDATAKHECLVQIARALGKWQQQLPIKFQLRPEAVTQAIAPYIGKTGFHCRYRIYKNGVESAAKEVNVVRMKGGLFVQVPGLGALVAVQFSIEAGGKIWVSDYESVDAVSIELREA